MLRLAAIERLITEHRIIVPPLARRTLTQMCEKGVFETAGNKPTSLGWLVYEDSFWKGSRSLITKAVKVDPLSRTGHYPETDAAKTGRGLGLDPPRRPDAATHNAKTTSVIRSGRVRCIV